MKACVSVCTRAREWKKERESERKDEREREREREREKKKKKGEKNQLEKNKETEDPFFVFGLEGKKKGRNYFKQKKQKTLD